MTTSERERLKYEIAAELGLLPKVEAQGWKALTARESGKLGGLLRSRVQADNEGVRP